MSLKKYNLLIILLKFLAGFFAETTSESSPTTGPFFNAVRRVIRKPSNAEGPEIKLNLRQT